MDREAFLRDYWAYYIMLEDKFIHTLNYVELSEDNFNTHSNEYAALMQMIEPPHIVRTVQKRGLQGVE